LRRYRYDHHSDAIRPSYNSIPRPSYKFGLRTLQGFAAAIH
jgi:hypothetical protein